MSQTSYGLDHPDRHYIDGQWAAPAAGGSIAVVSAHSEQVILTVAEAGEADMDAAVAAARRAFDEGPWSRMTPAGRGVALARFIAELEPLMPHVAQAWVDQTGALAVAAPFVMGGGLETLKFIVAQAETYPFVRTQAPADGRGEALVVREPVGVVVAIAPWNNPFGIMISKVGGALLAGCCIIMKPAPETPIEALLIAQAADRAGLPAGVIACVTSHREAADYLVCNPGVDKVSLTGSTVAGKRVASVCGERLARCTLELGGKSAAVILDDFDLEEAARILTATITMSAGQVCATLSRAIVSAHRHNALVDLIAAEMARVKVGSPLDPETQLGPLAMARQRERVESYIALGRQEGARLAFGGGRPAGLDTGYYVEPTLFADVAPGMRIAQEEIFGPVLCVIPVADEAEAIRVANDSPYGLFGAVFTHDRDAALRVARGVRTGTMSHNGFRFDPFLPFGGFKQSGLGREGGLDNITAYTEVKSILLDA